VLLRVEECRRFGGGVVRQRFVAREVACDAGVRVQAMGLAGTAPDTFKV
jgi:hypothetical protein